MAELKNIAALVRLAEKNSEQAAQDRIRSIEYYQGIMKDTPSEPGRSQMVSRVVQAQIKKALPPIIRTILGGDRVVEYLPVMQGDEAGAQQATDYVNEIVLLQRGHEVIEDAIHDAMRHNTGILRWWWASERRVRFSRHTGLPDEAFNTLVADDGVTVLEHSERQEQTELGPVNLHDCRIKRVDNDDRLEVSAVPHERFLIDPDATCIDDAAIVGEKTEVTRSELVSMGYDRDLVASFSNMGDDDDYEDNVRRQNFVADDDGDDPASEEVSYYDLYVRADMDDDGIAELRHMVFAGGLTEKNLLVNEECDDVQFAIVRILREPHQIEGQSISEDLIDIQRVNTVLLRQSLDNIYWQNNPQPTMQEGAVVDEEAVFNPEFGKPIRIKAGINIKDAYGFQSVPFVAQESFQMMEYFNKEARERTGISDASGGLPADALQNVTAKASAMIEQAGIGQVELMVRTLANDLRPFFRGMLRCIIRHQDVPATVRLRGQWVQFDPRDWNADMDCSVNVGLGAGTRERDMAMMQSVIGLQERVVATLGPENPFVKPDNFYNAAKRLTEASGLKSADLYFTKPDPQAMAMAAQHKQSQPSPDQLKAQAAMQIKQADTQAAMQMKQADLQATMQLEQAKMQSSTEKERAQMVADLQVASADRETQIQLKQMDIAWQREKLATEQRAQLAQHGLGVDANGQVVNPAAEAARQAMDHLHQALGVIGQHIANANANANAPKRVVRDANGDIIGLEPVPQVH